MRSNNNSGCLTAFVASFSRIMLLIAWIARPAMMNATFSSFILPCLGFLFLPFTTLMYVFLMQGVGTDSGPGLAVAVPGGHPGPRQRRRRRGGQSQSHPGRLSWLVRREGVVGCIACASNACATECGDTAWPGARSSRTGPANGLEAAIA